MPNYLVDAFVWQVIWPIPSLACVFAGLAWFFAQRNAEIFLVTFAFSLLGCVVGYLSGLSKEPAAILPGVLTLAGGVGVYLVAVEPVTRSKKMLSNVVLVGAAVSSLSLSLLFGQNWGASIKGEVETYQYSLEYQKKQALDELELIEYRRQLGLDASPHRAENEHNTGATQRQ